MALSEAAISAIGTSVAAALGTAGSIGGTAIANKKAYKNSVKFADYQNQLNIQNWNMQNAYNSPAAQMARFKEAGLNPNLIYGQGDAGNAGNIPAAHADTPQYQNPFQDLDIAGTVQSIIGQYKDNQLKDKQIDLLDARKITEKLKGAVETSKFNAYYVYACDKLGTGVETSSLIGYTGEGMVNGLRHTPWYKSLTLQDADANRVLAQIDLMSKQGSIYEKQGQILDYQDWNNDLVKSLFTNTTEMTLGEFFRGLLLVLTQSKLNPF